MSEKFNASERTNTRLKGSERTTTGLKGSERKLQKIILFNRQHLQPDIDEWKKKKRCKASIVKEPGTGKVKFIRENNFFGKIIRYEFVSDKHKYANNIKKVKLEDKNQRPHSVVLVAKKHRNDETQESFIEEVEICLDDDLVHENIVNYYKVLYDGRTIESSKTVYLLMEMITPGAFMKPIQTSWEYFCDETTTADGRHFSPVEMRDILLPIAQALAHLHSKRICHLDLKPMNIFIQKLPIGKIIPKLGDFGLARKVPETNMLPKSTMGSISFKSPERGKGGGFNPFKDDVWSLGLIMYTALTRKTLFVENISTITEKEFQNTLRKLPSNPEVLRKVIIFEPEERPDMESVVALLDKINY